MEYILSQCCFCAKNTEEKVISSTAICNWRKNQTKKIEQIFCFHIPCFKNALGSTAVTYVSMIFDDENE